MYRRYNPARAVGLPTATVGAISELRVAIDLFEKGYEVFRALSPTCSCDLAILNDGKLLRVEVKTAYRNTKGSTIPPPKGIRADVAALVLPDTIEYQPTLESVVPACRTNGERS